MDESLYDDFGNYIGPDLSDEDEDDEEELQQQQQQQQQRSDQAMDVDDEEDIDMQEENIATSTALSRIGGNINLWAGAFYLLSRASAFYSTL
jgi:U5 small nuclear ribonucleoprotein component